MNQFHLKFETDIHGREKKLGQLKGVVVNETATHVTHVILGQGMLFKQALVIPLSAVNSARLQQISLALYSDEAAAYPTFGEVTVEEGVSQTQSVETWAGTADMQFQGAVSVPVNSVREGSVVRQGVSAIDMVWDKQTPIYSRQGEVGHLFEVIVDGEDGRIVKLVMCQGRRPERLLTIPLAVIQEANEAAITLDMENGEIEELIEFFNFAPEPAPVSGKKVPLSLQDDPPLVASLAQELAQILNSDPRTETAVIDVACDRGVVTLMGTVADAETKEAAADLVNQHPDVLTLNNELKVKS